MTEANTSKAKIKITDEEYAALRQVTELLETRFVELGVQLYGDAPYKQARAILERWLKRAKNSAAAITQRHGNSKNFRKHYFPLIKYLHEKNPGHVWSYTELALSLGAMIKKGIGTVPNDFIVPEDEIRKIKLPKHKLRLQAEFGMKFAKNSPSSQSSALLT